MCVWEFGRVCVSAGKVRLVTCVRVCVWRRRGVLFIKIPVLPHVVICKTTDLNSGKPNQTLLLLHGGLTYRQTRRQTDDVRLNEWSAEAFKTNAPKTIFNKLNIRRCCCFCCCCCFFFFGKRKRRSFRPVRKMCSAMRRNPCAY